MTGTRGGGSRRRSRRGKGGGPAKPRLELTSVPTGRAAYAETRVWLLAQHGPVCAYCESVVAARSITLDHVTPRRGQTAYDRRDNLVLCCKACNSSKMDKPLLAFLLGSRKRVVALYKYGRHLSHQLVEMVDDLLPVDQRPAFPPPHTKVVKHRPAAREILGDLGEESPYHSGADDSPYLEHPAASHKARPSASPKARDAARPSGRPAARPAPNPKARPTASRTAPPATRPARHAPHPASAPIGAAAPAKRRRRRGGRGRGGGSGA